jgi:hypothetical protein
MRAVSTSFLAALIVAALFWGNCLTCPQAISASAHSCCPHGKKAGSECRTQVMRQFVKAEPHQVESPQLTAEAPAAEVLMLVLVQETGAEPVAAQHAPPDLLSLNSSFRV